MAYDLLTRGKIANDILNSILSTYDLDEAEERWQAEAMCIAALNLITSQQTDCDIDCERNVARFTWIDGGYRDFYDTRKNLLAILPNDRILGDITFSHDFNCRAHMHYQL